MSERCPECGWVFDDEEKLREHRQLHHGTNPALDLSADAGEQAAGVAAAPGEQGPSRALLIAGYAGAVLFSIVGLVIAVVLLAQRHTRHGLVILLISLAVLGAGIAIQLSQDDDGGGGGGGKRSQHNAQRADR